MYDNKHVDLDFDIYSLKLNESVMLSGIDAGLGTHVQRVPGGWIYSKFHFSYGVSSSVFVPFNKSLQELNIRQTDEEDATGAFDLGEHMKKFKVKETFKVTRWTIVQAGSMKMAEERIEDGQGEAGAELDEEWVYTDWDTLEEA